MSGICSTRCGAQKRRYDASFSCEAGAKVQVIRAELEKGAHDQEDEPFAELLMEELLGSPKPWGPEF